MIQMVCLGIYFVVLLVWSTFLFVGAAKYKELVKPLDIKKYWLKELYPIGFLILDMIHYSYDTLLDRQRLKQARIVYGEKYAEYYYRVNMAEKVTYLTLGVLLAPLAGVVFNSPVYCLFGLVAGIVLFVYADSKITDIIKAREESITRDFCEVVSKMALLINAGMITREAWDEISHTGEGTIYEEMRNASIDMQNGMSEIDAYIGFGNRCGTPFVNKFISMLVQNLSKGNKELVDFLKAETRSCWEEKKHMVKRQGEAAANKLMIPLAMILLGIFVMILMPIAGNMSF